MKAEIYEPYEEPGFYYEWVPDDSWSFCPGTGRKCRMQGCMNQAVAVLRRRMNRKHLGTIFVPWHYCSQHLYGRRIVNGVVECRILRQGNLPPAAIDPIQATDAARKETR